ncbi:MAG: transglutaminase domain-containing protein, partial [Candidatus Latescibacteria bacterium]|nr:transglutaminase domain-containing protein [Candidatus Latescibacterota bacterium]
RFYFQAYEPVRRSRMTVTIPNTKTLNYKAYRMPEGKETPRIIPGESATTYVWELTDVEPLIPEPSMPSYTTVIPSVEASLFENWDYIFDWLTRLQERRIQITPEIEQAVRDITADAADQEEKVARIYHFIQQTIRYISIKGSIGSGWSGHEAFYTLQNKYGDCIDKSILFTTMLNVLGVESEPIIILTNRAGAADRTIPSMRGNHAITLVHLNGRDFYLDATSTSHRYPAFRADDHGVTTINALKREIGFIDLPEPEQNRRTYTLSVRILPNGDAETEYASAYVGDYEARVRGFYMVRKESDHERMLANMVSSFSPDATLKDYALQNVYDISKPFSIGLSYILRDYVVEAGDLRIFAIPGAEMDFSETTLPERKYDIAY